jgi:hypothetical protein
VTTQLRPALLQTPEANDVEPRRPSVVRTESSPPSGSNDVHHQRYVLACAVITGAGQVLVDMHAVAKAPRAAASPADWPLLATAAQARTAAGAMSIVAGRLLTVVRNHDQYLLPALPLPRRAQAGVTVPESGEAEEWSASVRALASGAAECEVALSSCRAAGLTGDIVASLTQLHSLAEKLVALMDRSQLSK